MTKHTVTFQVLTDDKCELESKLKQFLWEIMDIHAHPVEDSLVVDGVCAAPCCEVPPEEEPEHDCDPYEERGLSRDDFI